MKLPSETPFVGLPVERVVLDLVLASSHARKAQTWQNCRSAGDVLSVAHPPVPSHAHIVRIVTSVMFVRDRKREYQYL